MTIEEKFDVSSEKLKYLYSINFPAENYKIEKVEIESIGFSKAKEILLGYRVEIEMKLFTWYFFDDVLSKLKDLNKTLYDFSVEYSLDEKCNLKINTTGKSSTYYLPYITKMVWDDDELFHVVVGFEVDLG